jgi:hypothetical protein
LSFERFFYNKKKKNKKMKEEKFEIEEEEIIEEEFEEVLDENEELIFDKEKKWNQIDLIQFNSLIDSKKFFSFIQSFFQIKRISLLNFPFRILKYHFLHKSKFFLFFL